MKSIAILFSIILVAALAYNWKPIASSVENLAWNVRYARGWFSDALASYERASGFEKDTENKNRLLYNKGNAFYKNWQWKEAQKQYESIGTDDPELSQKTSHNLGNTFYRMGEQETTASGRIASWKVSLQAYEKSLSIQKDSETEKNYEFVKKKLEELAKKEEEKKKKEEQKQQDEKSGSGQENGEKSGSGAKSDKGNEQGGKSQGSESPKPGQTWSNNGNYSNIGNKQDKEDPLTPEETKELENYSTSLQEFQKQNGKFLNPEPTTRDDPISRFLENNPSLRDMLPWKENSRDW